MMNHVAFIFLSAPHGNSAGKEGLDALLATSVLSENIGVFFIGDGVFQIVAEQNPTVILARNYIVTFKSILLYGIKSIWICATSMQKRGLSIDTKMVIDAAPLSEQLLREKLSYYNVILKF